MYYVTVNLKDLILDTLFPPLCFGCQKYHKDYWCENCSPKIEVNSSLFCSLCQRRLADNKKICHLEEGYRLAAATDYRNELVQKLIQNLKYNFLTSAMIPIKKTVDKYLITLKPINRIFPKNSIIIPIPLSKQRLRERGFNQSELIAGHLSQKLQLPIHQSLIIRIKNNLKQSEAENWEDRTKNIDGCFQITQPESARNKKIILVDDVFTSGATMNEAVKIFRQNGARQILAFVLARAR